MDRSTQEGPTESAVEVIEVRQAVLQSPIAQIALSSPTPSVTGKTRAEGVGSGTHVEPGTARPFARRRGLHQHRFVQVLVDTQIVGSRFEEFRRFRQIFLVPPWSFAWGSRQLLSYGLENG